MIWTRFNHEVFLNMKSGDKVRYMSTLRKRWYYGTVVIGRSMEYPEFEATWELNDGPFTCSINTSAVHVEIEHESIPEELFDI